MAKGLFGGLFGGQGLQMVGYSVTLTTSYRDSVMKIHRIYSIQW